MTLFNARYTLVAIHDGGLFQMSKKVFDNERQAQTAKDRAMRFESNVRGDPD